MKPFFTILLESYRGLKSQILFWITLGLSFLVALIFLSIGFDEKGVTFVGFNIIEEDMLSKSSPIVGVLYKWMFSFFVAGIWLTWVAIILALVSCAPIFPNAMTEGGAGMLMTKGVSRLEIFIAKFIGSLFFVLFQVGLFVAIVFLAFRWRLGEWHPEIFWYVPAVLLVFVSLYSFLVLIAVKTRSVLAAILLTMLVWAISGTLGFVEGVLRAQVMVEDYMDSIPTEEVVVKKETEGEETEDQPVEEDVSEEEPVQETETPQRITSTETVKRWHGIIKVVHSFLPKNGPIMEEAGRKLMMSDIENMSFDLNTKEGRESAEELEVQRKAMDNQNSSFYTIWSSVLFAGVMLSLAALSFCRRDY